MRSNTRIFLWVTVFTLISASNLFAQKLHVITSLDPLEAKEYITAFENDTGIKVEWIRLSAGEVIARLKAEEMRPSQSVWFGGPAPEYIQAVSMELLAPYSSSKTMTIPAKWRSPDNYWTGIYFGAIGFVVNTNFIAKYGRTPESWTDLLDPFYKGRITVAYPYTAGTGYAFLNGLVSIFGEDAAFDYYKKLDGQIHHYTKSGASPIIEAGIGEVEIGVVFAQDALRKGSSRGFPLKFIFPKDGVPYEIGAVGLVKGGPDVTEAKKFIDWVVGEKAQSMMTKYWRVPLLPGIKLPPGIEPPEKLNLPRQDLAKAGADRARLIKRWREMVGR